jgi:serine/threonine protein kinase
VTNYEEDPLKLKIKIIDMSLLASVHDLRKGNNNVCGSAYFSSPESSNGVINCKYDIWSVGIMTIVLFSRF